MTERPSPPVALAADAGDAAAVPGPFGRRRGDTRSLFGELLDWVLAPLIFLWPMSLALTWGVAQNIANRPFDLELTRQVRALAVVALPRTAANRPPAQPARGELERAALMLLGGDADEQRWFQVLGARGELLAGDPRLRVPDLGADVGHDVQLRDDEIGNEPVRVAWLRLGGGAALVQIAETLENRQRLTTEIIKGVLLPQFVILPVAVLLVWLALARGFRPLEELQRRIRRRESTDLSPIPERGVPEEVVPLVRSINDLLERLDKSIAAQRHFLADAAHQLKTPLAGLRMQAELAAREIDSGRGDAAAMKHSLVQIARSTQRASHMVNQLLAMARAEDSGEKLRRQWVDLGAVTRAVVRDFVPRAIERRIDLGYEGPDEIPAGGVGAAAPTRLLAEPVLLGELVRNLVDNALHYTPGGGRVTARVLADPSAPSVVLQVEDSGPGIAPADRERVFQPFYRSPDTQVDGSGLGLAIVQEIVQRHGGCIDIEDARPPGERAVASPGALFTVRLPRDGAAG